MVQSEGGGKGNELQQAHALFWPVDGVGEGSGVVLTSRETETRPGTDPGTGFLADVIKMATNASAC